MSLQPAENIEGSEFLNLKNLIAAQGNRPILAVCRIVGYAPFGVPAQGEGWKGTNYPVQTDVLLCSGPNSGEAYLGVTLDRGPITKTLRGVPNPKSPTEPLSPPKYPIGHELGVTFELKNPGADNAFVVANAPTAEQFAAISAVHAGGQGWANAQAIAARNAAAQAATASPRYPGQYGAADQGLGGHPGPQNFAPPAVPAAPAALAVPGLPPGVTAEMLAAFAAQQAQAAQVPATVGGAQTDPPW